MECVQVSLLPAAAACKGFTQLENVCVAPKLQEAPELNPAVKNVPNM